MWNQGSSYSHVLHKAVVSGPLGLMVYIYVHAVHSCGVTLLFEGQVVKLPATHLHRFEVWATLWKSGC